MPIYYKDAFGEVSKISDDVDLSTYATKEMLSAEQESVDRKIEGIRSLPQGGKAGDVVLMDSSGNPSWGEIKSGMSKEEAEAAVGDVISPIVERLKTI